VSCKLPNYFLPSPTTHYWGHVMYASSSAPSNVNSGSTSTPPARVGSAPNGTIGVGLKTDAVAEAQMRQAIRDLVYSVDPNARLEMEAENVLLDVASEFLESVTNFSSRLARHRASDTLDVKDLQLHLDRQHNIRIPGFVAAEDLAKLPAFRTSTSTSTLPSTLAAAAASSSAATTSTGGATKGKEKEKGGDKNTTEKPGPNLRAKRVAAAKGK